MAKYSIDTMVPPLSLHFYHSNTLKLSTCSYSEYLYPDISLLFLPVLVESGIFEMIVNSLHISYGGKEFIFPSISIWIDPVSYFNQHNAAREKIYNF